MERFKVLFISPNHDTEPRIPLGAAILISCLKQIDVDVRLLDTTFMFTDVNVSNKYKERQGVVEASDIEQYYGKRRNMNLEQYVTGMVKDFQPNLVAMTLVEYNFALGMKILKIIKENTHTPTLVGGILPIIKPDIVIEQKYVDMLCIGEGEETIVKVVNALREEKSIQKIENLWIKMNGQIIRNQKGALINLNEIPFQDWDLFDDRCIYKAFMGKVYRCGSFEMSRGCLMPCSFCVAPSIRNNINEGKGYQRWKFPERLVEEIELMVNRFNLNLVHFCDSNFLLGLKMDYLKKLSEIYIKRVNLPFMIQTGADTINEEKLFYLKEMGCITISIGVESGNSKIRQKVLKKYTSDAVIFNAFELAKKYNIRTTANYIIGLPYETEEDIWESIEFNKQLNPPSIAVHYFVPFVGTELYDICVKKGFYKGFDPHADVYRESPLNTDTLSKERIDEMLYIFINEYKKANSASFLLQK